jgi:gamma-glutamyltranspeptidase/glutathione hydrolase
MPELGWAAVTVPGAVDAWVTLSTRFGRLPFADLFAPAIHYAREGYVVSPITAARWAVAPQRFKAFPEFGAAFLPGGRAPAAGETFCCLAQADTLTEIALTRGESFYRGKLAERMVAHARATGGLLVEADLGEHRSNWVDTLAQEYAGVHLHEIPPNGQGLATLIALGVLKYHNLRNYPVDSANSVHLQVEAIKIALAEAQRHFADAAHMQVAPTAFQAEAFLEARAREIRLHRAAFPASALPADHGTVYLCTADAGGMMVSLIQSNYMGFGSGVVVPGTGISLQNRGHGFSLAPGHPNQVAGGKRPFHTIIPGFVLRGGAPLMSFGVMGGHMQAQGHLQMMIRIFDYAQNPQSASDAKRWHVCEDFRVALEQGFDPGVAEDLRRRGHQLILDAPESLFGGAQLIYKLPAGYCAASDHRKDGQAVGY